jgi:hypothetical protein
MPLIIHDSKMEELATTLAQLTGATNTQAVSRALSERYSAGLPLHR